MTITLRNTKGSELTFAELDGNFTDLDNRVQDSNGVRTLIDSAYVQARADSAYVTGIIDSAYVATVIPKMYKYFFECDSGQTVFKGADDYGNTLEYDSDTIMVYLNGMLMDENLDFTMGESAGDDKITTTMGMDSGHGLIITTWR